MALGAGAIATTVGLWWWLKKRANVVSQQPDVQAEISWGAVQFGNVGQNHCKSLSEN